NSGPCRWLARYSRTISRATGRRDGSTESSRSRINASAPTLSALACLRSLSPGTNSSDLNGIVGFLSSCRGNSAPLERRRATLGEGPGAFLYVVRVLQNAQEQLFH